MLGSMLVLGSISSPGSRLELRLDLGSDSGLRLGFRVRIRLDSGLGSDSGLGLG